MTMARTSTYSTTSTFRQSEVAFVPERGTFERANPSNVALDPGHVPLQQVRDQDIIAWARENDHSPYVKES